MTAKATAASRYHHGDLRNALLREATRMLEEDGAQRLSLRAVARSLGVSHAAPAHHFDGRDALLCEIAADGFEALADALEAALDAPGDALENTGVAYVDVALAHPQRFRLMFANSFLAREDCPPRLEEQSGRAYRALLRIAHGDAAAQIDPKGDEMGVPEFTTWSLVHGAATLYLDGALGQVQDEVTFRRLVVGMLRSVGVGDRRR